MASTTGLLKRVAREGWAVLVARTGLRGIRSVSSLQTDAPPATPIASKSYLHGVTDIPLLCKTLDQCLEETTHRCPEREALVFPLEGIRKTFAQFRQDVEQAAQGLLALGLKKGDRLGMWGPNKYEWVLMQFATAQAGIILVSVNPAYQSQELEFVVKKVGCKALVFPTQFKSQKYYEILKQVCPELEQSNPGALQSKKLPELSVVITSDSKLPGAFSMNDVMQAGDSSHKKQLEEIQKTLDCKEPINIQFTSGTTGSPKGATLSHHNIVNNAFLIGLRLRVQDGNARCCLPVPLYHCLGSVAGCVLMAIHGVCLVFPSLSFDAKAALKALDHEKCTHVHGTPTMFIDMLAQPDFASYNLSALRGGVIAGSPVPPEVMKKIINNMNMRELVVAYGTTENSPVTFMGFPQDNIAQKTETVGCVFPHTEAKIEDPETGEIIPLNSPGELQVRGYCVMLGYWADPNKTNEVMDDEKWYKTGDMAILDEYGYCKIVGRCKDMIIRGGENIYPAELEQFLHTHPKIQEVQVVGVKDERMGEEICATIRVKAGEECTAEEVKAFCKGKIAHFKIPRYVVFVKDFPLTVSGKIQKYKLRERMEKHLQLRTQQPSATQN
ncbi:medium-chain acyl-CoA ligase ACSF2, mitochondrial isoform X1 [Zootoca vivipara]|uniref:medium-chain acyl-CoA ligase ACSF2, mitochondrial isoform X1 n=2 Tax=Zootoca vivipara TaxID=8524 RepID=UPI001590C4D2|nr:medium-chain acyl-CoA ligase ACSF2, mitochondrial isoform X1 [Zootoca vivipara]